MHTYDAQHRREAPDYVRPSPELFQMHIDYLVRMANDIGAFFHSEPDATTAAAAIYNHLKRFWDPRMRAQIVAHYHETRGAGLEGPVLNAVQQLAAEAATRAPA